MPHPKPLEAQTLAGRRVLVTRTADRAQALASLLTGAGAEPLVLPLIDFERAQDQSPLDEGIDRLSAGGFDWLVVSSITTVRVLLEKAAERGVTLAHLVPAGTRVATVGESTRRALESVGLTVALAPVEAQSADGLLELWTAAPGQVFLPQADIAAPGLREGLAAKGADVTAVTAYHTVDFPAHTGRRLTAELPSAVVVEDQAPRIMSPAEAREALDAGTMDAVVLASPSGARRIARDFPGLGRCQVIAIGRPTAAAASQLGLAVAATAKEPTPDGIVAALVSVFANEGNPQ